MQGIVNCHTPLGTEIMLGKARKKLSGKGPGRGVFDAIGDGAPMRLHKSLFNPSLIKTCFKTHDFRFFCAFFRFFSFD
jgi:hypothetical protein